MRLRNGLLWVLLLILVSTGSVSAAALPEELGWNLIAPGIEYQKYSLPDPNNVFVVRMDRSNLGVTLESSIAQGKLALGRETVSGMYARYDQALNYWGGGANPPTWGMRNQVVVAINGIYFDWNTGIPQGGQVQSGWYAKRYDDYGGYSGFAWKLDRSAFMGECVYHLPDKQLITYVATANTQQITGINRPRDTNELILFTPQYNSHTGTDSSGVEVVVEMTRPTLILPAPNYARGIVRQIRINEGNSLIPFNSIVLSATGTAAQMLLANVVVGSEIGVSQEITSCLGYNPIDWTKTYTSIQGHFFFLKDGQIHDYDNLGATERNPRTAIVYNDQYIFFIVVDGRDIYHSVGMTIHELALFARDTLGATWGVAEDGGGSSTMVINGLVVNNTYCNNYGCQWKYATYLPLITHNSEKGVFVLPAEDEIVNSPAGVERAVANGMLMVIAQPGVYSAAFIPGDSVTASNDTEVRLGPGTNYASFATIPGGTPGSIVEQMNGLDGVLAKSTYWWYVNFGGVTGWVPEGALAKR